MKKRSGKPKKIDIDIAQLTKGSQFLGNKNAKVQIVIFSSSSCGFCEKARDVVMKLYDKYRDKIKIIYKHYNRNKMDIKSAMAMECAGEQHKFWDMYKIQFEEDVQGGVGSYAKKVGINIGKFNKCMASGKYKVKTKKDTEDGRGIGIRGTPSLLINDKLIVGYRPFEVMEKMILDELDE